MVHEYVSLPCCLSVCLSVCLCFHVSELQMGAKRAIGLFSLVATTESLYMWRATAYLAGRSCCGCVNRKELHGELHARPPWTYAPLVRVSVQSFGGLGVIRVRVTPNTSPNLLTLDLEFWLGLGLLELGDGLTVRV